MAKERKTIFDEGRDFESDDRSFEDQMEELGVAVERKNQKTARAKSGWLKPYFNLGNKGLTVSKARVSISEDIASKIESKKITLMVVDYEGCPAIAFKEDPQGYKLYKPKKGKSFRIMMGADLKKVFTEHGIKQGKYRVEQLRDGTFLAVWEDVK